MYCRTNIPFFIALVCAGLAQAVPVAQPLTRRFTVQRWTREEGLPQNSVKTLCMGPEGLLWGSANSQLWQFDGVRFVPGPTAPRSTSMESRIIRIGFDGADRLVIGKVDARALVFDGAWRELPKWDHLLYALPYDVVVASNRVYYLTASVVGWNESDAWRFAFQEPSATNQSSFKKGSLAKDGSLWIAAERGLHQLSGNVCRHIPVPVASDDFAYECVHAGPSGDVWLYRNPGDFYCLSINQWVALPPIPGSVPSRLGIVSMVERKKGELWAGGQHGLYRWAEGRWNAVFTGDGLYPPGINELIVDAQGRVWAATEGGGLLCFRERVVDVVRAKDGPAVQMFTALHVMPDGTLYAGIAGAGVWRGTLEGGFTSLAVPELAAQATVMSLADDGVGGLWVGALGHHLIHTDLKNTTTIIYPGERVPFMDSGVRALLTGRDGKLWVGTQRGIMVLESENVLRWPASQPVHTVNALAAWGENRIWAASETEGVLSFDAQTLKWQAENKGLGEPCVETIFVDSTGRLWAGGAFGLAWRDKETWRAFGEAVLPEGSRVLQILDDKNGFLWLGTDKGIVRITRDVSGTKTPGLILRKEDGLDQEACTGGFSPAGLRQADGRLLFPTRDGLAMVDPSRISLPEAPAAALADEIVADDTVCWRRNVLTSSRPVATYVRLPPGTRRVTIRWLTPEPGIGRTARFKTVLKSGQEQRSTTTSLREVSYENLPPDDYIFSLSAANRLSRWTATADIRFALLPEWWQRSSVQALLIMLLLGGVGGLGWWGARRRARRLRQADALRLRIARDLHDEIGANLGGIALLLDLAGGEGDAEAFQQIKKIVGQSIGTLKDMVWMIDPVHDNATDLVTRIKETAAMLLPTLPVTFDIVGAQLEGRVPTVVRRHILPVLKEALYNIVKHAQATRVTIRLVLQGHRILLAVEDDGVGLSETPSQGGHGLRNMRRRAEEMHAVLTVESRTEGGTRLTLDIPVTKDL